MHSSTVKFLQLTLRNLTFFFVIRLNLFKRRVFIRIRKKFGLQLNCYNLNPSGNL